MSFLEGLEQTISTKEAEMEAQIAESEKERDAIQPELNRLKEIYDAGYRKRSHIRHSFGQDVGHKRRQLAWLRAAESLSFAARYRTYGNSPIPTDDTALTVVWDHLFFENEKFRFELNIYQHATTEAAAHLSIESKKTGQWYSCRLVPSKRDEVEASTHTMAAWLKHVLDPFIDC
jgi:hypothetical protein